MGRRHISLAAALCAVVSVLPACGGGGGGGGGGGSSITITELRVTEVQGNAVNQSGPLAPFASTLGGDTVLMTGTGFLSGLTVRFGAVLAIVEQVTTNQVICTTPSGAEGFVTITVRNPDGGNTDVVGVFQFIAPPTVLSVTAQTGPTMGESRAPIAGGETMEVFGSNFKVGLSIFVDGRSVIATQVDDQHATFPAPATPDEQTTDVTVSNPEGLAHTSVNAFVYTQEFSLDIENNLLTEPRARHLYRRAAFGAGPGVIAQAMQDGLAATVTRLLTYTNDAALETVALGQYGANPPPGAGFNTRVNKQWWLHLLLNNPNPLQERMAYFLHDHFATSERDMAADFRWTLHRQIQLFRRFTLATNRTLADGSPGLGYDWKQLCIEISKDRAILDWLDGRVSRVGAPNENFARELWELFMLGEGQGYTENDIQETARAFTGFRWRRLDGNPYLDIEYVPSRHDTTAKTVFGVTGNFGYDNIAPFHPSGPGVATDPADTAGGIVSLTLQQRPVEASRFICRKLAEFFLYDDPHAVVVDALAARLRTPGPNQWNLRPILETILRSKAFFSSRAIKGKVKSPIEFELVFLRSTGIEFSGNITTNTSRMRTTLIDMGQVPLEPPDVNGWPDGTQWLAAQAQLERFNMLNLAIQELDDVATDLDPLLPPVGSRNPTQLVDHISRLLGVQLSGNARTRAIAYVTSTLSGDAVVPFAFDPANETHLRMKSRGLFWMIAQYHDGHQN